MTIVNQTLGYNSTTWAAKYLRARGHSCSPGTEVQQPMKLSTSETKSGRGTSGTRNRPGSVSTALSGTNAPGPTARGGEQMAI